MSKYGLKFEQKSEDCIDLLRTHHILLAHDDRSFARVKDRRPNILIQGENYHALKILQYTHRGRIDVIEIDPPYNTGNKDFVYNDRFVDREDSFRHSKWLSFMRHRLEIARDLLSERGVIFLHIDDNEFAQLKLLCDEVFGEENFVANLVWKKKATNGGMAKEGFGINVQHEYVLAYANDIDNYTINGVPGGEELDAKYKFSDEKGRYRLVDFAGYGLTYQQSLDYEIISPEGKRIKANDVMGVSYKAGWRWCKETYEANKDQIVWVKGKPKTKTYMNGDCQLVHPSSLLDDKKLLANLDSSVEDALGSKLFDYAKPVALVKHLLSIASKKDSIILDFFAGSGTTGQAVAELNKEDGGNRQFILITNNDKSEKLPEGICAQVCFPRLQKTIGDENLQVFRIDTIKKQGEFASHHIDQLVDGNKLLPLIQLQYGTFSVVVKGEQYNIYTNHDHSFFLAVWHSYIGAKAKKFKQQLNNYGTNNETLECLYDSYPQAYYKAMQ